MNRQKREANKCDTQKKGSRSAQAKEKTEITQKTETQGKFKFD